MKPDKRRVNGNGGAYNDQDESPPWGLIAIITAIIAAAWLCENVDSVNSTLAPILK
jgi:hypothetical protein